MAGPGTVYVASIGSGTVPVISGRTGKVTAVGNVPGPARMPVAGDARAAVPGGGEPARSG
jgi:DNA-binding beta-propeller fold protein YncE